MTPFEVLAHAARADSPILGSELSDALREAFAAGRLPEPDELEAFTWRELRTAAEAIGLHGLLTRHREIVRQLDAGEFPRLVEVLTALLRRMILTAKSPDVWTKH